MRALKIRKEWATDKDYFGEEYPHNLLLDDAIASYELRKKGNDGRTGTIDGAEESFIAMNHTNPINQTRYDKKILTDMDSVIKRGSIMEFDGAAWLVISPIYNRQAYKVSSVKECVESIEIAGVEVPFAVENSIQLYRLGVKEIRLGSVSNTTIVARIPDNETTRKLKEWDIIPVGRNNFRLTDIQDVIEPGLLVLKLERSIEDETEYPEIIEPNPDLPDEVEISGPDSILRRGTAEYSIDCDDVVFTLDGDCAKIDSYTDNTCVVKAGEEYGQVVLTAICDETAYSKTITIRSLF